MEYRRNYGSGQLADVFDDNVVSTAVNSRLGSTCGEVLMMNCH